MPTTKLLIGITSPGPESNGKVAYKVGDKTWHGTLYFSHTYGLTSAQEISATKEAQKAFERVIPFLTDLTLQHLAGTHCNAFGNPRDFAVIGEFEDGTFLPPIAAGVVCSDRIAKGAMEELWQAISRGPQSLN